VIEAEVTDLMLDEELQVVMIRYHRRIDLNIGPVM
jgi:hypothetical protein